MKKQRDPRQEIIDRQAAEIGRLRVMVDEYVAVTDILGRRAAELGDEISRLRAALAEAQKSQVAPPMALVSG